MIKVMYARAHTKPLSVYLSPMEEASFRVTGTVGGRSPAQLNDSECMLCITTRQMEAFTEMLSLGDAADAADRARTNATPRVSASTCAQRFQTLVSVPEGFKPEYTVHPMGRYPYAPFVRFHPGAMEVVTMPTADGGTTTFVNESKLYYNGASGAQGQPANTLQADF